MRQVWGASVTCRLTWLAKQPQPLLGKADFVAGQEAQPVVWPDVCLRTSSHDRLINAALLFHKTDQLSFQLVDNLKHLLLPLPTIWTLPGPDFA